MNIHAFDLNLLKVFAALFAEGSVTKAAERLGVSQPAASTSLRKLRDALGDPLFVRAGHKLTPTAVALELRPEVEKALTAISGLLDYGTDLDPARLNERFWLSGSDFFSELMMPRLLETIRLSAPNLQIVMVDRVFGTTLDALENGTVDIAFWPDLDMPKWVNRQHLVTTRFEFIARSGNKRLTSAGIGDGEPIPLDLTCDLSHVHFSPDGRTLDDMDLILTKMGRKRNIIATLPTFSAVLATVKGSDVIGTMPSHLIDRLGPHHGITRHPLPVDRADIPLMMLWNRRSDNAPGHRWLRGQIAECFAGL